MNSIDSKNSTVLLSLSAGLEYYDFVIYALMASYLGPLFFPNDSEIISQLQAFSIFALGYIVRPLGGMIFGILGDLNNRKNIFIKTNFILATSTMLIGILPTHDQIGILATFTLIILRIVQSLCFSAELPGAITIMQSINKTASKSFGFIISGTASGTILASIILYWLQQNFDQQEILEFAWRIPFIFGSTLCFIAMLMRNKLPEIPQAISNKKDIIKLVTSQVKNISTFIIIIMLPAYFIVMNLFFPIFIPYFYDYQTQEVYLAISFSILWAIIFAPIFTNLTYNTSKISLLKTTSILLIFLSLGMNFLLLRGGGMNLYVVLCLYQSLIVIIMTTIFPLMAEIFPNQIRFTMIAICYNIAFSIMGFSPQLVMYLANAINTPFIMWLVGIILSITMLTNISKLKA